MTRRRPAPTTRRNAPRASRSIPFPPAPIPRVTPSEVTRTWAWMGLGVIVLAALWVRLLNGGQPWATYWMDVASEIMDARNTAELGQHPLILNLGTREPFYNYFMAGLWLLFPGEPGPWIQRLGCCLFDLTTIWLVYLAGRELSGRRLGLIAAALTALARPLVIQSTLGMRIDTEPLAVAALILATLRVFRKPKASRFLGWGLAVALVGFTYTGARPWEPYAVLAVLAWCLARREERAALGSWAWASVALLGAAWPLFFILQNGHGTLSSGWGPWILVPAVPVVGIFWAQSRKTGDCPRTAGWAWATLGAAWILYPLMTHPLYASRFEGLDPFHSNTGPAVMLIIQKLRAAFQLILSGGFDRPDMTVNWGPFFSPVETGICALGVLGAFAPKDRGLHLWLLGGWAMGLAPFVLSADPHSGKLIGLVVPALLLGASALDRLLSLLPDLDSRRAALAGLLAVWVLMAPVQAKNLLVDYQKLYYTDRQVADACRSASRDAVVYLGWQWEDLSFFYWTTQSVLNEGVGVRRLLDSNRLELPPGQPVPEIKILFGENSILPIQARIRRDFPNATWTEVPLPADLSPTFRPTHGRAYLWQVEIPPGQLGQDPGRLVYLHRPNSTAWRRTFFNDVYGWGEGVVFYEDYVASPWDDLPMEMGGRMGVARGAFTVEQPGTYRLTLQTPNPTWAKLDGQTLFKVLPHAGGANLLRAERNLSAGTHPVEIRSWLRYATSLSEIRMEKVD